MAGVFSLPVTRIIEISTRSVHNRRMDSAPEHSDPVLRDDNLRLLFAPLEERLIDERILDIRAGAVLLAIFCFGSGLFTWGVVEPGASPFPENILGVSFVLVWIVAVAVSVFSPLIAIILGVEYIKVLRRRRDQQELLRRYGRG